SDTFVWGTHSTDSIGVSLAVHDKAKVVDTQASDWIREFVYDMTSDDDPRNDNFLLNLLWFLILRTESSNGCEQPGTHPSEGAHRPMPQTREGLGVSPIPL